MKNKKTKALTKSQRQSQARKERRTERQGALMKARWDRQQQIETRLVAVAGILEARAVHILRMSDNLKASEANLEARRVTAAEGRKLLEEMGEQPQPVTQDQ